MITSKPCITQLMLYGVPLPSHLQQERFEEYYPNSMLWQILCDIYRHYPRPLEDLFQNYKDRLAALHDMPNTPAPFHWEAFRRLHPILQALYGVDAIVTMRHHIPHYPYAPYTGVAQDVVQSEAYHMYMEHRMSGSDFFMEIQDSLFFNQLEKEQQNEYFNKYLLVAAKNNNRVTYGNTSPEYNITRADHGYSLKNIKDIYNYSRECIRRNIRFQHTDWLSVIRYNDHPLNIMLANLMYMRWHNDSLAFDDVEINPWYYCNGFNQNIPILQYIENYIKDTSLIIYIDLFVQCDKDSVMLELIDVVEHYQHVDPIMKNESPLFL